MKPSVRLAGALVALTPVAALAQSSVTLYGLVDSGISYANNVAPKLGAVGGRKIQETSGIGVPSRWGLRGTEDLGSGNVAVFVLENGFSVANGTLLQGSRLFGRQAYVGLGNKDLGTVTFGRQYESVVDFVGPFVSARQWGTQYGAHVGDIDNLYTTFRINNAVKYQSPTLWGITLGGLYAFSNQADGPNGTGFANNRAWSVGGSFTRDALTLGVGHFHLSNPSAGGTDGSNTSGAVVGDYANPTAIFYVRPVTSHDVTAAGVAYALERVHGGRCVYRMPSFATPITPASRCRTMRSTPNTGSRLHCLLAWRPSTASGTSKAPRRSPMSAMVRIRTGCSSTPG